MLKTLKFSLPTAAATERLGEALAQSLPQPQASGTVMYLRGELGAGKTTCVRSLLRTLGAVGAVRSPTYTLLETYGLPPLTCVHIDLYRLRSEAEVEELGLRDLLIAGHLLLIEWPEKGGLAVPPADMDLRLEYAVAGRVATLSGAAGVGEAWLRHMGQDRRLVSYVSNLT